MTTPEKQCRFGPWGEFPDEGPAIPRTKHETGALVLPDFQIEFDATSRAFRADTKRAMAGLGGARRRVSELLVVTLFLAATAALSRWGAAAIPFILGLMLGLTSLPALFVAMRTLLTRKRDKAPTRSTISFCNDHVTHRSDGLVAELAWSALVKAQETPSIVALQFPLFVLLIPKRELAEHIGIGRLLDFANAQIERHHPEVVRSRLRSRRLADRAWVAAMILVGLAFVVVIPLGALYRHPIPELAAILTPTGDGSWASVSTVTEAECITEPERYWIKSGRVNYCINSIVQRGDPGTDTVVVFLTGDVPKIAEQSSVRIPGNSPTSSAASPRPMD